MTLNLPARRAALSLFSAAVLFFAPATKAEPTNRLTEAELQGRDLARQLAAAKPAQNLTNTCVMQIRASKTQRRVPLFFQTTLGPGSWTTTYQTLTESNRITLVVIHAENKPTRYQLIDGAAPPGTPPADLSGKGITAPFAGSDFWLCDLGLEFFHWPAQKLLPKTTNLKRGRAYTLLESTSPDPAGNGYSRVLSWIDQESGGLLQAEAYDAQGKLLKVFEPKNFEKVNGQWQLEEIQIRNDQTGSRTRLEFDLQK